MNINELDLKGSYELKLNNFKDLRGSFVKYFHNDIFNNKNINLNIKECYYSISYKDVFRGMHFQLPPHDHEKYVFCTDGEILDIILDLRKNSQSFGKYTTLKLSMIESNAVYIPKGFAHGFLTLSTQATVVYNVSSVYEPKSDTGVKYDSFGFKMPISKPIVSDRDNSFESFMNFKSPF